MCNNIMELLLKILRKYHAVSDTEYLLTTSLPWQKREILKMSLGLVFPPKVANYLQQCYHTIQVSVGFNQILIK